jgi:transcriptional regulator GlxA family with amidase domain
MRTKSVLFVAPPNAQLLDVIGPMEAFDVANRVCERVGRKPPYALHLAALESTTATVAGVHIRAERLSNAQPAHTVVIGGNFDFLEQEVPAALTRALRPAVTQAERVVSVCAGAFVLGSLGLLDGKRCTTHWLALEALSKRHPLARVENDALYVSDGRVLTSAGVTTGIDLALHLIERDLGTKMALAVARLLVVSLHRPGGQSQFSAALRMSDGGDERLRRVVRLVTTNPSGDHRIESLAKKAAMSPRHFARLFVKVTGKTPAEFVEQVRVDAARAALEATDHTIERIADDCGFGTDETLRRTFQRQLGVTPSDYRKRFG